jgi:crossover junction endodeoxyribonuclease RuvC
MRTMVSNAPPLRVLGIDPGTHVCGWGVVAAEGGRLRCEGYGVVRAPATAPVERRLATIAKGLRDVIARHAPTEAAIEEVFYGRDVRAAVRIGEGRGAALVVLSDAGLPVRGYANNAVKHAVTGAGRAEKGRVHAMVKAILGLAEVTGPLDASDALAIAICHHHGRKTPAPRRGASRLAPRVEAAIRAARERGEWSGTGCLR